MRLTGVITHDVCLLKAHWNVSLDRTVHKVLHQVFGMYACPMTCIDTLSQIPGYLAECFKMHLDIDVKDEIMARMDHPDRNITEGYGRMLWRYLAEEYNKHLDHIGGLDVQSIEEV